MPSRHTDIERLHHELEAKLDDLARDLAETERHLLERRAEVEPVEAPLLPVLKRKRARKAAPRKST
jgi:hypothetical protein